MSLNRVIAARTHTPEYLLHKYWARKPHNIISYFIEQLVPEGGLVVDPFCGSGVVLREAQKLGREAMGFDVNPIAVLISSVLIDPPETEQFASTVSDLLAGIRREVSESFSAVWGDPTAGGDSEAEGDPVTGGDPANGVDPVAGGNPTDARRDDRGRRKIKYCIHEVVSACPKCGRELTPGTALREKRTYRCGDCGETVRFNLQNLKGTRIKGVVFEGQKEVCTDGEVLRRQEAEKDRALFPEDNGEYSFQFCENRRILAFQGMETRDLFTARNFSIICRLEREIDRIEDRRVRDAARLLLSASIAQLSRLIAVRNNQSTGGPAWSIPGFWVPAEHLETNPLVHLEARYQKFLKGLAALHEGRPGRDKSAPKGAGNVCRVEKASFDAGLDSLLGQGVRADLVFFDPPYGDSVPYLEFSAMWNSFLKEFPPAQADISVSDRISRQDAWDRYRDALFRALERIGAVLKENGRLLITFNNNDMRAWEALLSALQRNGYVCDYVTYQIPAVISSKAQTAVEGSYISDIYSVYRKSPGERPVCSLEPVSSSLVGCAGFRGGTIPRSLALRTALIAWMEENVDASLLPELDGILKGLFDEDSKGRLTLRRKKDVREENGGDDTQAGRAGTQAGKAGTQAGETGTQAGETGTQAGKPGGQSAFRRTALQIAEELLSQGPCGWAALYETVSAAVADYGIPDPYELKEALDGHVIFDGKRCLSYVSTESPTDEDYRQLSLFDPQ